MQRFKDFTKKSGKVASAILSAAMVTSMVAGTNVVYAAEVNTQAEANVKGQEQDEEKAAKAIAELVDAYKGLTVTAATKPADFEGASTIADYTDPAKEIADKYDYNYAADGSGDITLKYTAKAPETTKAGEGKLVITIKNASGSVAEKTVTYAIQSGNDRAKTVKAALAKFIDEEIIATNAIDGDAIVEDIKNNFLTKTTGTAIPLYADVKADSVNADLLNTTPAEGDTAGSFEGVVSAKLTSNGTTDFDPAVNVTVEVNKTIDTSATLVEKAKTGVDAYLNEVKYFNADSDENAVAAVINDYLKDNGLDSVVELAAGNTVAIDTKAGKITDGLLLADYTLQSKELGDDGKPVAKAEVKEKEIKIPSNQAMADQMVADITTVAEGVTVDSATTEAKYLEKLGKSFEKANKAVLVGTTADETVATDAPLVYGTGTTAEVKFYPAEATANKDSKPTAVITVTAGTGDAKVTEVRTYVYDVASAATAVAQAQTAVEAAWNNMTFTNATTEADATAAAKEALKAYPTVTLAGDKVVFVKDETSRTITLNAILEDSRNGETKQANASKSYDYLSNEFVEKDGKKFYYDENGQLLKNTFLQGTDSPDGYTYYIQNDGSVMQDRLTYHPNGKDVIYFDADGHEVFDAFVNVKKDVQGNAVDYIGYFGTLGGAYVNQTTYGNGVGAYSKDALFYINDYGVLENKGWFQNAAGEIGYAAPNGTLTTSQWSLDQFGRKVYFQANGFLAKGLMTDGVNYYQLDETDGHLVGEF
ncbi:MAG: hypothetical protein ACI4S1_16720 [Roseburia sp.]